MRAQVRKYERLEDYLEYVLNMANELKQDTKAFSRDRMQMMVVVNSIEYALDMVRERKDKELRDA